MSMFTLERPCPDLMKQLQAVQSFFRINSQLDCHHNHSRKWR